MGVRTYAIRLIDAMGWVVPAAGRTCSTRLQPNEWSDQFATHSATSKRCKLNILLEQNARHDYKRRARIASRAANTLEFTGRTAKAATAETSELGPLRTHIAAPPTPPLVPEAPQVVGCPSHHY